MKTFLNSDWLRAVQFFRNTVQKKEYSTNIINYLGSLIGLNMARNEGQWAPRIVGVEFREIMRPRHTALTKEW